MRKLTLAVLLIVVLSSLTVGCGCEEQAQKKALEEVGEELEQEAREVLPMLYRLREMEMTPGSDQASIQSLMNKIGAKSPGLIKEVGDYGDYFIDTEDAIEWTEGLTEEYEMAPENK